MADLHILTMSGGSWEHSCNTDLEFFCSAFAKSLGVAAAAPEHGRSGMSGGKSHLPGIREGLHLPLQKGTCPKQNESFPGTERCQQ